MENRKVLPIFIFLILLLALRTQAQEQLTPRELKQKTIVTEPQTLYKGFFRARLASNYGTSNKYFTLDGKREAWPSNIWESSWFYSTSLTYGITNRLQVDIVIPYEFLQRYQSTSYESRDLEIIQVSRWKNTGKGIGDLNVEFAYQVLTETETRPSYSLYVTAILPTGEKNPTNIKRDDFADIFGVQEFDPAVGSGEASVIAEARVRKVRYPFSYMFTGSYQIYFGGEKILNENFTEEDPFRSGSNFTVYGAFNFHLNDWIAFRNSAQYFFSVADTYDGVKEEYNSWIIEYVPGVIFQIKQFRIAQAITVPLFGKMSSADPSFTIVMGYTF